MTCCNDFSAARAPIIALMSFSLAVGAAFAETAEARSCGMMKPGPHMHMPMHPMPRPMYRAMPSGAGAAGMAGMIAGPTVIDIAKGTGDFSTLLKAVDAAGLTALLKGEGPYTLFAPTDAAFAALPEGALDELLADKAKLTAVLKLHVVPGRVKAADILTSKELETASGEALQTSDLSVIRADLPARNGVIHVIDKVLLPAG